MQNMSSASTIHAEPTPQTAAASSFDVAVVGGGMVGAALALALGRAGLKVALLERQTPVAVTTESEFDLRISAINRKSEAWLSQLTAWQALLPSRLASYQTLRAFEGEGQPLDFTAAELGESHLGHMVENNHLQQALWQQLPAQVQRFCPVRIFGMRQLADAAVLDTDQGEIRAQVLVAADGAQSQLKQLAGIGSQGWQYQQACMLVHVETAYDSLPMTWQQFTEQGPRAYLPLPGRQASLVWYDDQLNIQQLVKLAPAELQKQLQQHFPSQLGAVKVQKQAAFPLTRSHANQYVKGRLVLIGDAAHTINPLAGQGVNLGFADAELLAQLLVSQHQAGGPLADATLLLSYQQQRRRANLLMMSAMDMFYQVFKQPLPPLRLLRRVGLQVAGHSGPLKSWVGRYAAGL